MKITDIYFEDNQISLTTLVIIVGPNGVGKTTFLRDFYQQLINSTPGIAWEVEGIKWPRLLSGKFFDSSKAEWQKWAKETYKIQGIEQNGQAGYAVGEYLSHEDRTSYLYQNDRKNLLDALKNKGTDTLVLENAYGKPFKSQHSVLLSVDTRLQLSNNSGGQLIQKYSNDLKPAPFLSLNPAILIRINRSLRQLFGKQLHVEPHNYPSYTIDVARAGTKSPKKSSSTTKGLLENKKKYLAWFKSEKINPLQVEGHGVRAATEILYALENPRKKIIFIDEPELHLYPSTKYDLGRITANYSGRTKQVLLVTHDTEILRGLLHSAKEATVIRISTDRKIKSLSSKDIGKSYSSDILQAAFQDAVIVVEGLSDKYVYSSAIAIKHLADDISLQLVSMEGKNKLSIPLKFYKRLDIRNAVIADFDILFSHKRGVKDVVRILNSKGINKSEINVIEKKIDAIQVMLKGVSHKNRGLNNSEISKKNKESIEELLGNLKEKGVFLVPIGGLEDWVGLRSGTSAEAIFSRYRSASNSKFQSMGTFLNEVVEHLR